MKLDFNRKLNLVVYGYGAKFVDVYGEAVMDFD